MTEALGMAEMDSESQGPENDARASSRTPNTQGSGSGGCLKALVIVCLGALVCLTALAFFVGATVREMFTDPAGIVRNFFKQRTVVDGSQVLLEIKRTHGDNLEVASPTTTMEIVRTTDTKSLGPLYLGTTVTEVRVPTTYRFHIKLSEIKDAKMDGNVLTITVPRPIPALPAIDTSRMEKRSDSGWARFNQGTQLSDTERSVTPELVKRAEKQVEVVREVARKDAEEFVQKWIVNNNPAYRDQIKAIKVIFPDEDASKVKTQTPLP